MTLIEPITAEQQAQVCQITDQCIERLANIHRINVPSIPVKFDLKGRASGMYMVRGRKRFIRYNPYLFARYFDDNLSTTVPHEVAHYVSDVLFGLKNIKPHGKEWQQLMLSLGVKPEVTGNYDLHGIPVRRQKRFNYQCGCQQHQLTTVRHNKIQAGKARYFCRQCGSQIIAC
ncbi:MAG: SprT-like domain-containing protein [Gammaproteobacteria bacterium]|nr:SprT-like domain-containing protein [Gammaproteobacteria bacterium]